ncbi:RBP11-like subunits of RNA polymerase [Acaromyces ingoldii]|uniref:DNA-directed RNA polymerases I and III subunit RPAC2 n=1 Tax=Acaromyces ingoldii TaxID=215250 RepID=A0A316YQQ6_9BASI|nr:RBP11-like subunits of RNA polymerase [Acaromyces ingoldii]PWN91717.1 RBP11-like subunits of RNA polymerase [Acaromyces ingoldii]
MAEVPQASEPQAIDQVAMDTDQESVPGLNDKIEILKGYEKDLSAATYCLHQEDHTLGNVIRYMLMKNPQVQYCGYSNPHPSEPKIHLRIQMFDGQSSLVALKEALDNLETLFETIGSSYSKDLSEGKFERFREPGANEEELRAIVERGKQIRQAQKIDAENRRRATEMDVPDE